MSLITQFLDRVETLGHKRAAKEEAERNTLVCLQLLLEAWHIKDEGALWRPLANYDPSLLKAMVSVFEQSQAGHTMAEIHWQGQRFGLIGAASPLGRGTVSECLASVRCDERARGQIHAHCAHVLLYAEAKRDHVSANYTRLAMMGAAIGGSGKPLALLNQRAHTAVLPASWRPTNSAPREEFWKGLPPLSFFAGVSWQFAPATGEMWLVTRGLEAWGAPNLAALAPAHRKDATLKTFNSIASFLQRQGKVMAAGDTIEIGDSLCLRLRAPRYAGEVPGAPEGELLVVEWPPEGHAPLRKEPAREAPVRAFRRP